VCTWDDHEVANGYAGGHAPDPGEQAGFAARRAAAWQAWYEHLPVAATARPGHGRIALARRIRWGRLAAFHVLDTRTFRSGDPCGGDLARRCAGALDPAATMLGTGQEHWLLDGLARSAAGWNVLAQGVVMAPIRAPALLGDLYNMDQWDGYVAARRRLLDFLAARRPANPVVISGDVHSTWINDLHHDPDDLDSEIVATELVGTSISSAPPRALVGSAPLVQAANPHVRWLDAARRGYLRCELTRGTWRTDVRVVDTVRRPEAGVSTAASFVVESGLPGATRA
jgi:alkaline phosphatase D